MVIKGDMSNVLRLQYKNKIVILSIFFRIVLLFYWITSLYDHELLSHSSFLDTCSMNFSLLCFSSEDQETNICFVIIITITFFTAVFDILTRGRILYYKSLKSYISKYWGRWRWKVCLYWDKCLMKRSWELGG